MKNILQQILIYLFSGIIVIASGGFGLVHHYCGCTEKENISILTETSCCYDGMENLACNSESVTESSSCCQVDIREKPVKSHTCNGKNDCCSSEYFYFKTDNFDLSGHHRINLDFDIAYTAIILEDQNLNRLTEGFTFPINNNLPPPEYGKELLFSIHQLKIATPLV